LTCSDSRLPPEVIFDQGLGDLFVVRVAGNVVDAALAGSVEYAVGHLHTPLVVVIGHERCGAVEATLDSIQHSTKPHGDIGALVTASLPRSLSQKSGLVTCWTTQFASIPKCRATRSPSRRNWRDR